MIAMIQQLTYWGKIRSLDMPSGIGAVGRSELARVLGRGRRFVTPADASAALGIDTPSAAKKLSRWAEDGWLRRVRRGLYIGVPVDAADPASWSEDPLVVAAEVWPCYFTGWTSASEWALTDQVFRTTVLKTTARVRAASVRLLDHEYLIGSAHDPDMSWGLKTQWRSESRLRFADPARTVIDVLDSPKLGGGMRHGAEILAAYLDEHHPMTLIDYADRVGNGAIFKRMGFAIEALSRDLPELTRASRERVTAGIAALDPDGPPGGRIVTRWNLRVNVTLAPEEPA
jgi:predicted transcriptional regulator of viral defense system